MTKLERARELRADTARHYNCCQSVVLPFAEELGLDEEAVLNLTEHFGSGMRRGSVCGAVTGGLMALGLMGKNSSQDAQAFQRAFREWVQHLECAELLKCAKERGEEKKEHCDRLVFFAVELVEEMLKS